MTFITYAILRNQTSKLSLLRILKYGFSFRKILDNSKKTGLLYFHEHKWINQSYLKNIPEVFPLSGVPKVVKLFSG